MVGGLWILVCVDLERAKPSWGRDADCDCGYCGDSVVDGEAGEKCGLGIC